MSISRIYNEEYYKEPLGGEQRPIIILRMTRKLATERDVGVGSKLEATKLSNKINGLLCSLKRY